MRRIGLLLCGYTPCGGSCQLARRSTRQPATITAHGIDIVWNSIISFDANFRFPDRPSTRNFRRMIKRRKVHRGTSVDQQWLIAFARRSRQPTSRSTAGRNRRLIGLLWASLCGRHYGNRVFLVKSKCRHAPMESHRSLPQKEQGIHRWSGEVRRRHLYRCTQQQHVTAKSMKDAASHSEENSTRARYGQINRFERPRNDAEVRAPSCMPAVYRQILALGFVAAARLKMPPTGRGIARLHRAVVSVAPLRCPATCGACEIYCPLRICGNADPIDFTGPASCSTRSLPGALILLFAALAGPQLGFHWEQVNRRGNEIIFAIDTSRSMLTPDVKPNRLTRAASPSLLRRNSLR